MAQDPSYSQYPPTTHHQSSSTSSSTTPTISAPYPLGSPYPPTSATSSPFVPLQSRAPSQYTPTSQRPMNGYNSNMDSASPSSVGKKGPHKLTRYPTQQVPTSASSGGSSFKLGKTRSQVEDEKEMNEEEREMMRRGMINWDEMKSWRFWIRKEWTLYYLLTIVILVLVALMTLYHKQIVDWLQPFATKLKEIKFGWLIPIGILFVISFPPLFGHEIVGVLVGVVWGLWVGFGIVAAGTFLGEMGNYFAFKYLFRAKAAKMEKKNLNYGLMAHVIREGGFVVAVIVRLSAIPGHFSTVVFSTCGLSVWVFIVACILSMPKQLIVVYLGVALGDVNATSQSKIVEDVVLTISFLVTVFAAWYIYRKMNQARLVVWRKHRQNLEASGMSMDGIPNDPGQYNQRMSTYGGKGAVGEGRPSEEEEEDLDDATSPLTKDGKRAKRQPSYLNPFDISYKRHDDGMSVYGVDDVPTSSTQLPLATNEYRNHGPTAEEDIGLEHARYQPEQYLRSRPSSEAFPTPKPAIPSGGQVRRDVSDAFSERELSYGNSGGYLDPPMQAFPVPSPSNSAHGSPRIANAQPQQYLGSQQSSQQSSQQRPPPAQQYGAESHGYEPQTQKGYGQTTEQGQGQWRPEERQRVALSDAGVV